MPSANLGRIMSNPGTILVGGAGGFIGGYLVKELLAKGHTVRAVDFKRHGHQTP